MVRVHQLLDKCDILSKAITLIWSYFRMLDLFEQFCLQWTLYGAFYQCFCIWFQYIRIPSKSQDAKTFQFTVSNLGDPKGLDCVQQPDTKWVDIYFSS